MAKTKSTNIIDPNVIPKFRNGEALDDKLSSYIVIALESAVEQVVTPQGVVNKQPTPQELCKRINLANEVEAVADGETLTMSKDDFDLIQKCVSTHFMPAISTRILVALSSVESNKH